MANIKFGTDGWRAIIGEDFISENVETVTNAIGKYVADEFGLEKKILVGYDPRNMAKAFATQCADLLACAGFEVFLSDGVLPTPVLAYGAKIMNACAIMFTASHNPPEYLGIKFIPDYAGPATNEITDKIVANLSKRSKPMGTGVVHMFDFKPKYFEHLKELINFEAIKKGTNNGIKIIFDGLYCATIGYFDKFLEEFSIPYEAIHMQHDPNFGGGMPEPKPKYLKELIEKVKNSKQMENDTALVEERNLEMCHCEERGTSDAAIQEKNIFNESSPSHLLSSSPKDLSPFTVHRSLGAVGMANDGDGDRFGVINENGEYVSPNEIIAILLMYLKNNKKMQGCLVKTVGASLLLDKVAQKLNVEVVETAVGFKHVGEAMREFNPIIGGEESGGLSIQCHIPEKDGILANLLILEAMSVKGKSLVELQQELYDFAGAKFYNELVNLKLETCEQVKRALVHAKNLHEVDGLKVIKTDLKDGVKLYLEDNSSWILVRPSGTEPLLRIYFESDSLEKIEKLKEEIKQTIS